MNRFDRYMLSQLLAHFGFFVLVLVLIFWINRAVKLFDQLVGNGHALRVFAEFSTLSLPVTIALVMPIASFATAVYVANRMRTESELVTMQASGLSPWRLSRPVLLFGVVVMLLMLALTHALIPLSRAQLNQRQMEITRNVNAKLLNPGEFIHPKAGLTFYIRDISRDGILHDVFLSDLRDPENTYTYTSERAYLLTRGETSTLVMASGMAQAIETRTQRMAVVHFNDFSFDVSKLVNEAGLWRETFTHLASPRLIAERRALRASGQAERGAIGVEINTRFATAGFGLVAALIGFCVLQTGTFSRFGVWRQILASFACLVTLKIVESAVLGPVQDDPRLWPLLYLPVALGLLISGGLLTLAASERVLPPWLPRRRLAQ